MNCKYCGYSATDELPLCPVCGQWAVQPVPALPAPKKCHTRLPYFLLLSMLLIGTVLYFLLPSGSSVPTESQPAAQEMVPGSKPILQGDCFRMEEGVLYFDESKFLPNEILIIPSAIAQEPVTVISAQCFAGLEGVTTIILPSTITAIEDGAFEGCSDLRGLDIPEGVQRIGKDAFRDCIKLESLSLPSSLASIGKNAFENCASLRFIFYNGLYEQWHTLYPDTITPFTWVICLDGEYRQTP